MGRIQEAVEHPRGRRVQPGRIREAVAHLLRQFNAPDCLRDDWWAELGVRADQPEGGIVDNLPSSSPLSRGPVGIVDTLPSSRWGLLPLRPVWTVSLSGTSAPRVVRYELGDQEGGTSSLEARRIREFASGLIRDAALRLEPPVRSGPDRPERSPSPTLPTSTSVGPRTDPAESISATPGIRTGHTLSATVGAHPKMGGSILFAHPPYPIRPPPTRTWLCSVSPNVHCGTADTMSSPAPPPHPPILVSTSAGHGVLRTAAVNMCHVLTPPLRHPCRVEASRGFFC